MKRAGILNDISLGIFQVFLFHTKWIRSVGTEARFARFYAILGGNMEYNL